KKKRMGNAERFINTYNKIEAFLNKKENYDSYASFSYKVKNSKNKVVRRFKDDLISFGELRNAIVHNPNHGGKPIAEPYKITVEKLDDLYERITNPKKVIPTFQFPILGARK